MIAGARKYWGRAARDMPRPGLRERKAPPLNLVDRQVMETWEILRVCLAGSRRSHPFVPAIRQVLLELEALDAEELEARARDLSPQLRAEGFRPDLAAQALAIASEAVRRVFGFLPRNEQLAGAGYLLEGRLVEMATGEGKTITALLAAATAALAGRTVHVVTVNSYLAQRDHDLGAPVLAALGISSAMLCEGQEPLDRTRALTRQVIFCDNKEVTFEYLRGLLARSRTGSGSLPNLDFAIVDEADSILIDEAGTPLIIAEPQPEPDAAWRGLALAIATQLVEKQHWRRAPGGRSARLTARGRDAVATLVAEAGLGGLWQVVPARRERVEQALAAIHLYIRDVDYLVEDGKVIIIDAFTGRRMPDRAWQAGLHQMIETREGALISDPRVSRAQITFRDLFGRYRRLGGMTGTGREVAGEFRSVFGMKFIRIRPHRPVRRGFSGLETFADEATKTVRVAELSIQLAASGRAVLVGTRSLSASEAIAGEIRRRGGNCAVLSARDHACEAETIGGAGRPGAITVATNMAGRGADIPVLDAVARIGGLHVILFEFQLSRRVDRQLIGRCARNGQPGNWIAAASCEDELFRVTHPSLVAVAHRVGIFSVPILAGLLVRYCQTSAQRASRSDRRAMDRGIKGRLDRLAFSGCKPETH